MLDYNKNKPYNLTADQGVTSALIRLTKTMMEHRMADGQITAEAEKYQCKSCERELIASAFYVSCKSRCKECVKASVRANRAEKIEYYRSYDRLRYREQDHRKEAARNSAKSEAGVRSRQRYAERIKDTPVRRARIAVGNAIRDGKMARGAECFFCGGSARLQAHHPDYSRPLDVFWLCASCHGKLHTINGDFLRGEVTP